MIVPTGHAGHRGGPRRLQRGPADARSGTQSSTGVAQWLNARSFIHSSILALRPGRLYRSESNRMVAGVTGGLGAHFDIDPTIVRLGFVAPAFLGGSGIVAYLVAWIIVPPESRPDTPPESVPRENLEELRDGIQRGTHGARESLERSPGQGGKDAEPPPQPSSTAAPAADAEPPDEAPARD